jgi:YegS/Rv2252/BmrU family lipid kinase
LDETLFIINPTSGRGSAQQAWAEARRELLALGLKLAEHRTQAPGEAIEVTRAALAGGLRRVVAVGGDGTLNEVVNGYLDPAGLPIDPFAAVGLIPSGTGSDFSRSIGLDSFRDAIAAIARPDTWPIDAVKVDFRASDGPLGSRFCINIASFGLGAETVALVNRWRDRLPGWVGGRARFHLAALRALELYKNVPVVITLDEEREIAASSNLIVVANGRFAGGGMMLAPNAAIDDGLIDVIVADGVSRLAVVRELGRIRRGDHLKNPRVSEYRARTVSISAREPLGLEIDGESVGTTPARLAVLPSAVRFIKAPPKKRP